MFYAVWAEFSFDPICSNAFGCASYYHDAGYRHFADESDFYAWAKSKGFERSDELSYKFGGIICVDENDCRGLTILTRCNSETPAAVAADCMKRAVRMTWGEE